jgi:hypothetical protein
MTQTFVGDTIVRDFQAVTLNSGLLTVATTAPTAQTDTKPKTGTLTTKGAAIPAGTAQLQGAVLLPECTAGSVTAWSLSGSLPESWQSGITLFTVVMTGQVDIYLVNTTAVSLTPSAEKVNVQLLK